MYAATEAAANASIHRDLATLSKMFRLDLEGGRLR
jgi:hypothetical protein